MPKGNPGLHALPATAHEGVFATTHWSVVLAAGERNNSEAAAALEALCRAYWYPLYVFVRREGHTPENAQDLTQDFFYRLLEKDYIGNADRRRGKFRTFLLVSLKHFLINEWKRSGRLKRGGALIAFSFDSEEVEERYSAEQMDASDPVHSYDRQWAVALIEQVLSRLRGEYGAADKAELFTALKAFVWGETDVASYAEIGRRLNLSEGNVKVAVHRLRQRFREVLRAEVAQTVNRPEDVEEELRYLIGVLS